MTDDVTLISDFPGVTTGPVTLHHLLRSRNPKVRTMFKIKIENGQFPECPFKVKESSESKEEEGEQRGGEGVKRKS